MERNTTLGDKLEKFVNDTILSLACDSRIDHRDYDRYSQHEQSRLVSLRNELNSIDLAIGECVSELLNDELFLEIYDDLQDNDNKSDVDFMTDMKSNLFNHSVEIIGLYEINNLHADDSDEIRDKFNEIMGIDT